MPKAARGEETYDVATKAWMVSFICFGVIIDLSIRNFCGIIII